MKHTLVALMEDRPGVLTRVVSLFRRRNFNIESLAVGHTETTGISRMTLVVEGSAGDVEQVTKQLYKLINVRKVSDVSEDPTVDRELALIRVSAKPASRTEIVQIANIFRANVVDVAPTSLMIEAVGPENKIESLITMLRSYGIKEMVRTGKVSMVRGTAAVSKELGNGTSPNGHKM